MPLSVHKCSAPVWPLGVVVVPTVGTPVNIMVNVDANNNNAPETAVGPGRGTGAEFTPTCHRIFYQGCHAGNNNNGLVINTGNVYLCMAPAGGTGGRADSGTIVFLIFPGASGQWPSAEADLNAVSPYKFFLDADSNNDGALLSLQVS